jgi:sterol desaturase/sphingolipid hydroxylase (fatty acid hydroxylase superfamily)
MTYIEYYTLCILFFLIAERIRPERLQLISRKQYLSDMMYLIYNGHFAGYFISIFTVYFITNMNTIGLDLTMFNLSTLSESSIVIQLFVGFLVKDFLSWVVHNLLHRISFLWNFHKVHHSAEEMDFMVVMRFHWMEIIIYKSLLYVPLSLIGISQDAMLFVIFFDVFWGFFNHSNLKINLGPLKYLLNSPQMHIWHHEYTKNRMNLNFGITLSLWDWLFGTVYWPKGNPKRLGFEKIEKYPQNIVTQQLYPFIKFNKLDKTF